MCLGWEDLWQRCVPYQLLGALLESGEGSPPTQQLLRVSYQSHWDRLGGTGWVSPTTHSNHGSQSPFTEGQAVCACPEVGRWLRWLPEF